MWIALAILLLQTGPVETRVLDLRGQWLFRVGDDPAYARTDLDERRWSPIFVPAAWEDEGYPALDGIHWYRIRFDLPAQLPPGDLYLDLGRIDDADQTFFNGELIGQSGQFPPFYQTAYHQWRSYRIPAHLIRRGASNTVAVRVYDDKLHGGILEGRIGIVARTVPDRVMDLSGIWRFRTGDDPDRARDGFDDRNWMPMMVPSPWNSHESLVDYDGFGWYRHRFIAPSTSEDGPLWLVLGKIDDTDEVWLNGTRLGGTTAEPSSPWQQIRFYRVPAGLIRPGRENRIAVRVLDIGLDGGIYEGPVGLYRDVTPFYRANQRIGAPQQPEATLSDRFWRWLMGW